MTHHSSQAAATRLEYDHNGRLLSKNPCARDVGTTVSLQNLFSTLPVRHREFLRNIKREFSKLVHVLQGYCLVSTGVRITCSNQVEKGKKTTIVSTNGSEQVKDNITCVFGRKQVGETYCCSLVNLPAGVPIELQNKASVPMTIFLFQLYAVRSHIHPYALLPSTSHTPVPYLPLKSSCSSRFPHKLVPPTHSRYPQTSYLHPLEKVLVLVRACQYLCGGNRSFYSFLFYFILCS